MRGREPPRASVLARQGAPAGEYLGLVVYVACLFYCGGFLGGEAPAGECAGADMFRAVSIAADFSTDAPE